MMRKKQKILLVSPLPPPLGGIASWTQRLIQKGLDDNFEIVLVDSKMLGTRKISEKTMITFLEIKRTLNILFRFMKVIRHQQIACVHINSSLSPFGIFRDFLILKLSSVYRIPVISHYRGNIPDFSEKAFFGLSKKCLMLMIKNSQANVVLNKSSFAEAIRFNPKQCYLIPNFVEDSMIERFDSSFSKGCSVIFVGGLTKLKGIFEILAVAKLLPKINFLLVGGVKQDAKEALKKLPNNIYLLGEMNNESVIQALSQANIFFFPSHTEGFPNAVLEAMSVGLPVVATKVGSIAEMIDEGKGGILIEKYDIEGMVKGILRLVASPNLLIEMGNYNKDKVKSYYAFSVVKKLLINLYTQVSKDSCVA